MTTEGSSPPQPIKILLADDGSQHSLAAVNLLCDLPLPSDSQITALAVLGPNQTARRELMLAALEQAKTILKEKGVKVVSKLSFGHPAEVITAEGDALSPNLIIMGAQGLRAQSFRNVLGILLGGVAQQVVEYSRWPVMIVRTPYNGLRQALVAIDGSEYSQQAIDYLCRGGQWLNFRQSTLQVTVMHVLPPILPPEVMAHSFTSPDVIVPVPPQEINDEVRANEEERYAQSLVDKAVAALQASGLNANGMHVRGDAASEIIDYVKEHQVDLVVVGSRGLNAVKGWLLGSVSRKLVHYAGCSVLVIKSRE